jgi:hypothetical protein
VTSSCRAPAPFWRPARTGSCSRSIPIPIRALSDGFQQLDFEAFGKLMEALDLAGDRGCRNSGTNLPRPYVEASLRGDTAPKGLEK